MFSKLGRVRATAIAGLLAAGASPSPPMPTRPAMCC